MATKQPSDPTPSSAVPAPSSAVPETLPYGTQPATEDPAPEYDPSHFGVYQFEPGVREALINAEKPHIDPKLLQDTVPPNKPVVTKVDEVATTPRGGFTAPKAVASRESAVARDAPTRVAVPVPKSTPKASNEAPAKTPEVSSAPPVDTSRDKDTLRLRVKPRERERNNIKLVAAIVCAGFALIGIALGKSCIKAPGSEAAGNAERADAEVQGAPVPAAPRAASVPEAAPVVAATDTSSPPSAATPQGSAETEPASKAAKRRGASAAQTVSTSPPAPAARAEASSSPLPTEGRRKRLFGTDPLRPPTTSQ